MNVAASSLRCREIRLRQFRNFAGLELTFPPAGAAIVGDNGSGKTNLLEAVHYLEILRSFRGASDEQLVRFGADAFHIRGRFVEDDTGRELEITAAYEPATRRKRVTIDGASVDRLGDAIGRVGTVIFSPSDVAIVSGGPAERRRFLDIVLSLNVRGYLAALQRYRQVLRQRNALLREGWSGDALDAWDAGLVESGARVMHHRATWVAGHALRFAELYTRVSGGLACEMEFDPDVPIDGDVAPEDACAAAFAERLRRVASRERERGVTMAGPHRDDVSLRMRTDDGPIDLRQFGSGGQVRTAAIALRMIEAETVRESRGRTPLLLLDDVFAELDPGRSARILELFRADAPGQVILTAPKQSDVVFDDAGGPPLARWSIAAGRITT